MSSSSSLQKLSTVLIYTEHEEFQYHYLLNALNRNFVDVSKVLTEPPTETNKPFYWIAYTEQHLLNCLQNYKNGIPIGYALLLRYLARLENKTNLSLDCLRRKTQSLFSKLTICTSGIHQKTKNDIKLIVRHLAGTFDGNFTDSTTHLIETTIGSAKHKAAVEMSENCSIVTPKWLFQ